MTAIAATWTYRIFIACAAAGLLRLVIGPSAADRITALSMISSLVLAVLVLFGATEGKAAYLDVALIYDIFGFIGILAIATLAKERA